MATAAKQGHSHPVSSLFFVPGEFVVMVEHRGLDPQVIAQNLFRVLTEDRRFKNRLDGRRITIKPERIISITPQPPNSDPSYQGVTKKGSSGKRKKAIIPKFRDKRPRVVEDKALALSEATPFATVFVELDDPDKGDPKALARLIGDLNVIIITGERQQQYELIVRSVSPNWFINGGPGGSHTGGSGPGGRPVPATGAPTLADYQFMLRQIPGLDGSEAETDVDVIILDTAPSQKDIEDAYTKLPNQELLHSMLGPTGTFGVDATLTIHYAGTLNTTLPPDPTATTGAVIKYHDYPQADHGLFAAGIIHSIAPKARLHLLQVLNDYGVGTLDTIMRGLEWAINHHRESGRPTIVNCSLMLSMPLAGHPMRERPDIWQLLRLLDSGRLNIASLALPLEHTCNTLFTETSLIVASSGNDGDDPELADGNVVKQSRLHTGDGAEAPNATARKNDDEPGLHRPQARYPAAFDTVLGVGALREDSVELASYSNLPDEPEGTGIATFGGEKNSSAPESETKPDRGILGVYIGPFPDHPDVASTGWGWWAGTSFAAPVITGTLAALAGNLDSLRLAEQVLEWSVAPAAAASSGTGGVFPARQGLGLTSA
jgi:hypothetical protein